MLGADARRHVFMSRYEVRTLAGDLYTSDVWCDVESADCNRILDNSIAVTKLQKHFPAQLNFVITTSLL
jgi:hypothetical protein